MSAYFSIEIGFDTSDKDKKEHLVKNFYGWLDQIGISFKRGYRKSDGYSLTEQIQINQNYVDGRKENNGSFDQVIFYSDEFDFMKGYWDIWGENDIAFRLLLLEDDIIEYAKQGCVIRRERMNAVKEFCIKIWEMPEANLIQTGWEESDVPPRFSKISAKCQPQTEPFSMVLKRKYHEQWGLEARDIGREGVLLENDKRFRYDQ